MTTATKRKPINGYRTMTAAQRYNARMERIMDECKDAKTRFNLSSRENENDLQAEVDALSEQLAANHARLSTTTEEQVVAPSPHAEEETDNA